MRPPQDARLAAPEFPARTQWLNTPFERLDRLLGSHAVLVEFFDSARINSHRTLPYVKAWHARYAEHGLRVIGVHCPGYSFGRDPEVAQRAIAALGIDYPVALDPQLELWRVYGNRGWPGRYLFDRTGTLRYIHYGEGDYLDAERAVGEVLGELQTGFEAPEPLKPVRAEDAEGVLLEAQSADVSLPGERERLELVRDWTDGEDFIEAADAGGAATATWHGGEAYAVLSGAVEPGLYQSDGTIVADDPGLRLHGFQFTPAPPSRAR
ncbi:MAG: redoxin domain-containing protein [Thermoleophilaceae bacterium]